MDRVEGSAADKDWNEECLGLVTAANGAVPNDWDRHPK